jgi:hypothetical protein
MRIVFLFRGLALDCSSFLEPVTKPNGVLNLSTRKSRVLAETMRVLQPGGRVSITGSCVDGGATGRRTQESGGARRLTGGNTGGPCAAEEVLQRGIRGDRGRRSSVVRTGGSVALIRCSRRSSWNSCVRRCLRIATTSWCRRSPSRPASRRALLTSGASRHNAEPAHP